MASSKVRVIKVEKDATSNAEHVTAVGSGSATWGNTNSIGFVARAGSYLIGEEVVVDIPGLAE